MSALWSLYASICAVVVSVSILLYIVPNVILTFALGPQNLKEKYGNWALITGASSGIGLSIARKLAAQGINLVIVALDDPLLSASVAGLRDSFPNLEVRSVPVNLSKDPEVYEKAIRDATADIPVSVVVNNAGFLKMGFFDEIPAPLHIANVECNTLAAIRISHMMYERMIQEGRRGCLCFTSSAAWFMPAPFATMYGGSKAMLSNFAVSLSIEAKNHNVDVCVVHPSYTHSNLYKDQPKIGVLDVLSRFGWTGDDVADVMLTSVGRVIVRDAGAYSIATNILSRIVDSGSLALMIMPFRNTMTPPPQSRRK